MLEQYKEKLERVEGFVKEATSLLEPLEREARERFGLSLQTTNALEELRKRITGNRKVVLAVVGQVNSGKSTLLNVLLGDDILPTAASPKTARLSVIEYTEDEPKAKVHFYTPEEWKEMEMAAKQESGALVDRVYSEIVESAKSKLGSQIGSYLGKTIEVSSLDLDDYVAADGKFSDIVKFVELFNPYPLLEDITIVDTPGTNDPVRSRSEQTLRYLSEADAVIFLTASHAKRVLDKNDLQLALEQLMRAGIDELILVIPQVDSFDQEEMRELEKEIIPNLRERVDRFMRENPQFDGERVRELVKRWYDPKSAVPVSALAYKIADKLESQKPLSEDEEWYYQKMKEHGWPEDPEGLRQRSNIEALKKAIDERVVRRKVEILFKRPLSILEAEVDRAIGEANRRRREAEEQIQDLKTSVEELKRKLIEKETSLQNLQDKLEDLKFRLNSAVDEMKEAQISIDTSSLYPPYANSIEMAHALAHDMNTEINRLLKNLFKETKDKLQEVVKKLSHEIRDFVENLEQEDPTLKGLFAEVDREVRAARDRIVGEVSEILDKNIKVVVSVSVPGLLGKAWDWLTGRKWIKINQANRDLQRGAAEASSALEKLAVELELKLKNAANRFLDQYVGFITSWADEQMRELSRVRNEIEEKRKSVEDMIKEREEMVEFLTRLSEVLRKVQERAIRLKEEVIG